MRADAIEFLQSRSAMYDLIFVDPPTFSNSKRADDFDVQRDHVRLLQLCGERLLPGGTIVFSNNFRRFKLDQAALADLRSATSPRRRFRSISSGIRASTNASNFTKNDIGSAWAGSN